MHTTSGVVKRLLTDSGPVCLLFRDTSRKPWMLAFIITSALLGPASIVLTFTMFGLVWGALRVALPLIAVCGLGLGLQPFGSKLQSGGGVIPESPALRHVDAAAVTPAVLLAKTVLFGQAS